MPALRLPKTAGWQVISSTGCAAARRQINRGVRQSRCRRRSWFCTPTRCRPTTPIAVVRTTLLDDPSSVALASFTPIIGGAETVRWGTTFHNWIKTWYAPLLFRPHVFLKGGRLLFGDHAMFFRRADFLAVGGCDETLMIMEDADLCLRLVRLGRVRLVNRLVITSDRRVAAWGGLKANWIYLYVGARWGLGLRKRIERHYPDVR